MANFTIYGDADTYMDEVWPTVNFGGAIVWLGWYTKTNEYVALLRSDFSATIPAGSTIDTASLYVYASGFTGLDMTVHGYRIRTATRDWAEFEATWNIYKTANNWGEAGAKSAATDYDSSVTFGPLTINAASQWFSIDCKTFMQDAVDNRTRVFDARLANYTLPGEGQSSYCSLAQIDSPQEWYITGTYTPAAAGGSRNRGYVFGSRRLEPEPPRGWLRRRGLQGLLVPA